MQHYQRIRDLREDADLTQAVLAEELRMYKTTYTNYEQGKHTVPLDFAVLLAEFYHVSIDYIAGRTNVKRDVCDLMITEEERNLLKLYTKLSERNKGKVELLIEQLYRQQMK